MTNARDRVEDELRGLLEGGVAARLFPGAVASLSAGRAAPISVAVGAHTYEAGATPVGPRTLFDVASLTKVLATTTAVLQLVGQKRLALTDAVGTYIAPFRNGDRAAITLRHLLTHTSGLRADFDRLTMGGDWGRATPADLWGQIEQGPLSASPGTQYVYSDLGFLLLGRIVELVAETPLDAYVDEHVCQPLGMSRTRFRPPSDWWPETAPTEYDASWRGRLLQGEVHDEKAFLLGGVAGHAGLFSTAEDIHRFLLALRNAVADGEDGFVLDRALAVEMTRNQIPGLPVRQGLGWFLDQAFLGDFRQDGFGHTGFTGVSVAADPARAVHCILLTNCVYPTRPGKEVRGQMTEIRARITGLARRLG